MNAFPRILVPLAVLVFMPAVSCAECFDSAGLAYGVNPWVLRGIAYVESRFNPHAVNRNRNGTIDVGMMQTNSVHFATLGRYGITPGDLTDACRSVYVAAWMLRDKMNRHGNTWKAVGAYHSETPFYRDRYANTVRNTLVKWGVVGRNR